MSEIRMIVWNKQRINKKVFKRTLTHHFTVNNMGGLNLKNKNGESKFPSIVPATQGVTVEGLLEAGNSN